jgi:hypothetical protein
VRDQNLELEKLPGAPLLFRQPRLSRKAGARLGATERYGPSDRSGPGAYGVTVIATLDDPLTFFVANDLSDVMRPDHDRTNGGAAGVCSVMRPGPGEIE